MQWLINILREAIALFTGLFLVASPTILNTPIFGMTAYPTVNSYCFYKTITIDHNKVASTTSATPENYVNFPMLVSLTDSNLTATSSGGHIFNTYGHDIQFATSSASGTTLKPREIEDYLGTTGRLNAWTKLDSISTTTDTVLYMYYNNTAEASTSPSLADPSVWNSSYKGVWHLPDGTTLTTNDSTSNGYNLTNNGSMTAASGQIDGTHNKTNGTSQYLYNASISSPTSITVSFWNKVLSADRAGNSGSTFQFGGDGTVNPRLLAHAPYSDNTLYWDYGNPTNGSGRISTSYAAYLDTWTYVSLVYDNSNGLHRIYFNGNSIASATASISNPNLTAIQMARFGASNWNKQQLDEFRVSSSARSADWIKTEYNNQSATSTFYTVGSETASGFCGGGGAVNTPHTIINTKTIINTNVIIP